MWRLTRAEFKRLQERRVTGVKRITSTLTGKRWEDEFAAQLEDAGIAYRREYRFVPGRKFRFDFAFPDRQIAVEIDGAVHRIKVRFHSDREKGNLAILHGWRVLHVGPDAVRDGRALEILRQLV